MRLFERIFGKARQPLESAPFDAGLKLQAQRNTPGGAPDEVTVEYNRLVLQKYGRDLAEGRSLS
jgi:hypothetical protein